MHSRHTCTVACLELRGTLPQLRRSVAAEWRRLQLPRQQMTACRRYPLLPLPQEPAPLHLAGSLVLFRDGETLLKMHLNIVPGHLLGLFDLFGNRLTRLRCVLNCF